MENKKYFKCTSCGLLWSDALFKGRVASNILCPCGIEMIEINKEEYIKLNKQYKVQKLITGNFTSRNR
jgi:hypothetical protein